MVMRNTKKVIGIKCLAFTLVLAMSSLLCLTSIASAMTIDSYYKNPPSKDGGKGDDPYVPVDATGFLPSWVVVLPPAKPVKN